MKKRITLLSIIVAILSFVNVGSVSAYNPSQFDFVPEPVYNVLRRILIEFGINPGESFIIFAKFVMFVLLFAVFFYGASKFFKDNKRVATIVSIALALFSVILIPGTYVLRMAQLYAGIVGIVFPLLLIWLGFKMYKNFEEFPPLKAVIDLLALSVLMMTMSAAAESTELAFLTETTKWFGLVWIFFAFMFLIHLFETIGWMGSELKFTGPGFFSKMADKVMGGEKKTVKKAEAEAKALERETDMIGDLETKMYDLVHAAKKYENDYFKIIEYILTTLSELKTIAAHIQKEGGTEELAVAFDTTYNQVYTALDHFLTELQSHLLNRELFKKDLEKETKTLHQAEEILTKLRTDLRNANTRLSSLRNKEVTRLHRAGIMGPHNRLGALQKEQQELAPIQQEIIMLLGELERPNPAGAGNVGLIEEHKRALLGIIGEVQTFKNRIQQLRTVPSRTAKGAKAPNMVSLIDGMHSRLAKMYGEIKKMFEEDSKIKEIVEKHTQIISKIKELDEKQRMVWAEIESALVKHQEELESMVKEKKKIAKQIIETALEHIKGPSGAILTYDNSDEAQVIRDIRAADVPVGLMSDRDIQTEMRVIAASKGMRHR